MARSDPPSAAAVALSASSSRPESTSRAPSAASCSAHARPSPREAPVTTYTRSLRPRSMSPPCGSSSAGPRRSATLRHRLRRMAYRTRGAADLRRRPGAATRGARPERGVLDVLVAHPARRARPCGPPRPPRRRSRGRSAAVLHLAQRVVDEQDVGGDGEAPPVPGVRQVRAEVGVGAGEQPRCVRRPRLLRGEDAVRPVERRPAPSAPTSSAAIRRSWPGTSYAPSAGSNGRSRTTTSTGPDGAAGTCGSRVADSPKSIQPRSTASALPSGQPQRDDAPRSRTGPRSGRLRTSSVRVGVVRARDAHRRPLRGAGSAAAGDARTSASGTGAAP